MEAILIAQKLHKARERKQAVEKELNYLFSPRMKPVSITKEIDYNTLETFIELIHNTSCLSKLSSFDILPEELARLCGRRYLSGKHMSWVIQKLNSMQSNVLCIYQVNTKNCFLFLMLDAPKLWGKMAFSKQKMV